MDYVPVVFNQVYGVGSLASFKGDHGIGYALYCISTRGHTLWPTVYVNGGLTALHLDVGPTGW